VRTCEDINECVGNGGLGLCGSSAKAIACHNGDGNYSCDCQPGFYFDNATCIGLLSLRTTAVFIRLEARLQPSIGNALQLVLMVFTRSGITAPKVNQFE